MKPKYRMKAKTGEYEKDGQKKGKYLEVGTVFARDDGTYCAKLEAMPLVAGQDGVWVNLYPIEQRGG